MSDPCYFEKGRKHSRARRFTRLVLFLSIFIVSFGLAKKDVAASSAWYARRTAPGATTQTDTSRTAPSGTTQTGTSGNTPSGTTQTDTSGNTSGIVQGTRATVLSLSSTSLGFGSQPVQTTSAAQTITLINSDATTLNIASLTVTGANAGDFVQTNSCGSSVAAGATCIIAVMFTPSAAGARTAALSIADNASNSPQSVSLSGSGNHDVILSWTASASPGVIGYNVYRGTTRGGESSTPINPTPTSGPRYTDQNVTPGATYYYSVTAIGADGAPSAASSEAAATVP
jgi:hypothetical protein